MRLSVNIPTTLAAVAFAVAFLGAISAISVNVEAWRDAGLFFLALTGLVYWHRGTP